MIINPQVIGSQQPHRKKGLHRIDLQEHRGEHCIEDQREREETIEPLAMDQQVCGKLLTHHQKGGKVDAEALQGRFPLRQSTAKGLPMGSLENRNLW